MSNNSRTRRTSPDTHAPAKYKKNCARFAPVCMTTPEITECPDAILARRSLHSPCPNLQLLLRRRRTTTLRTSRPQELQDIITHPGVLCAFQYTAARISIRATEFIQAPIQPGPDTSLARIHHHSHEESATTPLRKQPTAPPPLLEPFNVHIHIRQSQLAKKKKKSGRLATWRHRRSHQGNDLGTCIRPQGPLQRSPI